MKYITRYEVTLPLGAGGSLLKVYKTLEEAKTYKDTKDFNIYKSVYGITPRGSKFRLESKRVY